jgi:hypothetical protein
MKNFKLALVALVLGATATTAMAWGDREQGALLGLIIGGHIVGQHQRAPVYVQPAPMYVQPPVYYQPVPVYVQPPVVYLQDGTRLTYSYQSGLWVDSQNRAYSLPR